MLNNDKSGKSNESSKLLQQKDQEILNLKNQLDQVVASVKVEGGRQDDAPRIITKIAANKEKRGRAGYP